MDAAPPATVASKVAKHVRNEERTTSRKMRNFLLDAAEAWVQCVSTRRWIWTRGGADPVCGPRVTCEDGSRARMTLEDDAAALVPSNPRVKKDEHDSGESETPWWDLQTFLTNPSLFQTAKLLGSTEESLEKATTEGTPLPLSTPPWTRRREAETSSNRIH